MSPSDEPTDPVAQAIRQFKEAILDLQARHEALQKQVSGLENELQNAQLRLRAALDALRDASAVLSAEGIVLVANDRFELLELGRPGKPPAAGLRELAATRNPDVVRTVEIDTPSGRKKLHASLARVGDVEGTMLLVVREES
jgi:cell division septum initiation protein DivIVA